MKSDNRYLAGIIEKPSKYLSKYNEFKRLFKEDKSISALSKYQL